MHMHREDEQVESNRLDAKQVVGPVKKRRYWRDSVLLLVLIIGVVLLWPAKWGGLFGIIVVDGHSMEPTFHTGDVVVSIKAPNYHIGDVIAYQVPDQQIGAGGHVIHRIAAIDERKGETIYETKGDNNPTKDAWTVTKQDIFGKQLILIPKIGSFVTTSQGGVIVGVVLAVVVIIAIWPSSAKPSKHSRHAAMGGT